MRSSFNEFSEFDQVRFDSPQNLTDFNTRVVWCSPILRSSFQENMENVKQTAKILSFQKNIMVNCPFPSSLAGMVMNHNNHLEKSHLLISPASSHSSRIWRPFPTEIVSTTTLNAAKTTLPTTKKEASLPQMSCTDYFPVILPSLVKLGESTSSVFKAVKRRKHQCQYCDVSFLNGGQLAAHVRVHTGSKPYHCEHRGCSRSFARNEELTRHRRIHSGDKPHECNVCNKRFGRKDHLNKHKKTHLKASEKKIYLCQVSGCGHKYTRSDALTRHLTTAHFIKHVRKRK